MSPSSEPALTLPRQAPKAVKWIDVGDLPQGIASFLLQRCEIRLDQSKRQESRPSPLIELCDLMASLA